MTTTDTRPAARQRLAEVTAARDALHTRVVAIRRQLYPNLPQLPHPDDDPAYIARLFGDTPHLQAARRRALSRDAAWMSTKPRKANT